MKGQIKEKILLILTGLLAGTANGLFGGGGGMLVVPMLILLLHKPPKKAHATALLVVLPLTVVSGVVYAMFGSFSFPVGLPAGIGVVVGGAVGALLLKKISNGVLTKIFAFLMLFAGAKLLFF
ncbi:MAG: sulfite exporter TauE/SafE family protein [Clostridia bacterium]|nr:sulfite exporter TauE/SafE family protein [Clostridia bacterium]MBR2968332.1 sulfite exporter TauE/SafE family protein [Clostridia bacterium]